MRRYIYADYFQATNRSPAIRTNITCLPVVTTQLPTTAKN